MADILGLGVGSTDYFFDVDERFLKDYKLKPGDDLLISARNLSLEKLTKKLPILSKSPGGIPINTLTVLNHLGIKTRFIGDKDSICACLLSHNRSHRTFLFSKPTKESEIISTITPKYLEKFRYVFLGPHLRNPDRAIKNLSKLFSRVDEKKLLFNPSTVYSYLGLKKITPLLHKTFVLFINDSEIKMLTGKNPDQGSRELLKYGPEIVVCTLGEKGALITTKDTQFISPAKKVTRIVDTTGAGDTFAAGFIYGLIKNKSLKWSGKFANNMAAKALTDFGQNWLHSFNKL